MEVIHISEITSQDYTENGVGKALERALIMHCMIYSTHTGEQHLCEHRHVIAKCKLT
jgi:hypothetical protein